jgi:membrane associated rhomboid family serine protease
MIALYVMGTAVEKRLKPHSYLLVYGLSGIIAGYSQALFHHLTQPHVQDYALGASGAVSGVGGVALVMVSSTYALYGPEKPWIFKLSALKSNIITGKTAAPFEYHIAFLVLLFQMFLVNIFQAALLSSSEMINFHVGIYAHLGGSLCGIIMGLWIRFSDSGRGEYYKSLGFRKFADGDWWAADDLLNKAEKPLSDDPLIPICGTGVSPVKMMVFSYFHGRDAHATKRDLSKYELSGFKSPAVSFRRSPWRRDGPAPC